jgi:hypothetical protein
MKWNCDQLQKAFTEWTIAELEKRRIPHAVFSRDSGLQTTLDGSTFRKLKSGTRKWNFSDLCKLADYFNESPSAILRKVEKRLLRSAKG